MQFDQSIIHHDMQTEKEKVDVSETVRGKTKGTTTFLPTVEQGSQNHLSCSPPSLTMNP
jgi:hypothetical protein